MFTFLVRENREFFTKKINMKIELSEYFKYDFKCGYLFYLYYSYVYNI